jgi:Ni/Co efflux regulator RcnB
VNGCNLPSKPAIWKDYLLRCGSGDLRARLLKIDGSADGAVLGSGGDFIRPFIAGGRFLHPTSLEVKPVKQIGKLLALSALSAMLLGGAAYAQERHDPHPYVKHEEWKKGYHMKQEDWGRAEKVDYHTYHLPAPRSGYEWREVDGNYVMAAVATGVIASTIVAASVH